MTSLTGKKTTDFLIVFALACAVAGFFATKIQIEESQAKKIQYQQVCDKEGGATITLNGKLMCVKEILPSQPLEN